MARTRKAKVETVDLSPEELEQIITAHFKAQGREVAKIEWSYYSSPEYGEDYFDGAEVQLKIEEVQSEQR